MGQSRWSTRTKRLKGNVDLEMGNVAMELELKGIGSMWCKCYGLINRFPFPGSLVIL